MNGHKIGCLLFGVIILSISFVLFMGISWIVFIILGALEINEWDEVYKVINFISLFFPLLMFLIMQMIFFEFYKKLRSSK